MKVKLPAKKKEGLDLTPMTDMVFIILIFFIVGASFELNRSIRIELPEAMTGESSLERTKIMIEVSADGRIYMDYRPVDRQNLTGEIRRIEGFRELSVYLIGDSGVSYGLMIEILDLLKLMGLSDILLVTRAKEGL